MPIKLYVDVKPNEREKKGSEKFVQYFSQESREERRVL